MCLTWCLSWLFCAPGCCDRVPGHLRKTDSGCVCLRDDDVGCVRLRSVDSGFGRFATGRGCCRSAFSCWRGGDLACWRDGGRVVAIRSTGVRAAVCATRVRASSVRANRVRVVAIRSTRVRIRSIRATRVRVVVIQGRFRPLNVQEANPHCVDGRKANPEVCRCPGDEPWIPPMSEIRTQKLADSRKKSLKARRWPAGEPMLHRWPESEPALLRWVLGELGTEPMDPGEPEIRPVVGRRAQGPSMVGGTNSEARRCWEQSTEACRWPGSCLGRELECRA